MAKTKTTQKKAATEKRTAVKKAPAPRKATHPTPKKAARTATATATATSLSASIVVNQCHASEQPIVVSFPSGLPQALSIEASSNKKNGTSGSNGLSTPKTNTLANGKFPEFYWQQLNHKSKAGRRVVGRDDSCLYLGETRGPAFDDRRTKLCVGIYDKKTGTLKLTEAASRGTVFSLDQSVPSYTDDTLHSQGIHGRAALEYGALFEDFGSSKKRKVLKSQRANQVDPNHVVGAGKTSALVENLKHGASMSASNRDAIELSHADGSKEALTGADIAFAVSRRNFLPTYDETAKKAFKVYDARNIVGQEAWSKIHRKVTYAIHNSSDGDEDGGGVLVAILDMCQKDACNPSIITLIEEIFGGDSTASSATADQLACALVTNDLMNFYKSNNSRKFLPPLDHGNARYFGIPLEIAQEALANFTTPLSKEDGTTGHVMSKANKDKCLVNILILFMIAHGSSMTISNLNPIANDLTLSIPDASQLLKMAGCTVTKKSKAATTVSLKMPLTFPNARRGGGRGK